ncbi:hypothetical protein JHK82_032072 [Glycine max]|uniref:Uncharacterized protein n=2 Tax=Glycine subgen. Soja TaxID=1462606 RepID=A0A0R0HXX1_SOYBN|nr:hypothetical protein JHK85_032745 [Glycine max]KAG5125335.1 hypothetical protein JHK82_032072 [Glycine max]KAH1160347.1 hypothetical protein GYH30_031901 [Glycine max]RZB72920.1 hypothetical protein D0Y65_036920 [Glycine soja]
MLTQMLFMLFFACLLIIAPILSPNPNGYTKHQVYSTLGLMCKCFDGKGGECRSTWEDDACSNLVCNPWKYY